MVKRSTVRVAGTLQGTRLDALEVRACRLAPATPRAPLGTDATTVFDQYLREFRRLERGFDHHGGVHEADSRALAEQLVDLSEELGRRMLMLACATSAPAVSVALRAHPLHSELILQSPMLRRALEKPRGYAGDMGLMLRICQPPAPDSSFAGHLDAFCGLPASQAVRDRVHMLAGLLDELPAGSRVLNLACGPALEVQSHFRRRPESSLVVDLVDHDLETLRYLKVLPSGSVNRLQGNAFRILRGDLRVHDADVAMPPRAKTSQDPAVLRGGYDLIYSAGLYDYVPDRDLSQIRAFTNAIDRPHTLELVDENGHRLRCAEESVIGFVAVRAR